VPRFKALALPLAAFLICPLSARHVVGQQFDPRERFEVPARVRLSSNVMRSLMKNHVMPSYPDEARSKGIQGHVALKLSLDEDGRVSNAEVVSGDPILATVALEAAKKLRFQPYFLNGEAVATEGHISYIFKLAQNGRASVDFAAKGHQAPQAGL
jgi:TonB family protein